jgi:hypothetical protein
VTGKERAIPAATSALAAGQPVLKPQTGPLKVGQKAEDQAAHPEQPTADQADGPDATASRPRGVTRTRRTTGRRPAPAVAYAVAMTVRLDPDEASEVDLFVLTLRDNTARTRLDKAEVIRELLRLAREDDVTRRKLLKRL